MLISNQAELMVEFEVLTVDGYGKPLQRDRKSTLSYCEALGDGIDLEMVKIPAGQFVMGAPQTEEGWQPNQYPQQEISIAAFWMGQFPVTQAQWSAIAALPKVERSFSAAPFCFTGANHPAEQVSWEDAVEFCARLSAYSGRVYRLPSEAEWEYGCRASSMQTPFHFGETISTDLANYSGVNWEYEGRICSKGFYGKGSPGSDRRETTEVGSFGVANAFGLYDMHGLVREWCADCWHENYDGIPTDGSAWITGGDCQKRVLRGGSWNSSPRACRSAFRGKADIASCLYDIGFRVVMAA
jgi:formylglycine-generating enzyme required for sulfatase activity